jgi:hypothetical protein
MRNRVALEIPRNGGVSSIRTWSPSPETGDGRGIPVSVSELEDWQIDRLKGLSERRNQPGQECEPVIVLDNNDVTRPLVC